MAPATFQHSQFFNAASTLQTEANGIPRMGNLYQIEGIDDDERTGLLQIIIPPAESIQTVDISTNNFEAELGRAIGAVTNVTLKSGSNAFHGSAFEFIRTTLSTPAPTSAAPSVICHTTTTAAASAVPSSKTSFSSSATTSRTSDHERVSNTLTIPDSRYYTPNAQGNIDLSAALGAVDPASRQKSARSTTSKRRRPDHAAHPLREQSDPVQRGQSSFARRSSRWSMPQLAPMES